MCGHPALNDENSISFQYDFGGILDHNYFYAANSFADPRTGRRIFWGWIPEEDVPLNRCRAKGWNGCQSLPREVYLLEIVNVVHTWRTLLDELASFELHHEPNGSFKMLGIRPLIDLARLRRQKTPSFTLSNRALPILKSNVLASESDSASLKLESVTTLPIRSTKWELEASIAIHPSCSRAGFHIRHGSNPPTSTSIYFSPSDEEIVVDRSKSRSTLPRTTEGTEDDDLVNTRDEPGPHTLFAFASTNKNGEAAEMAERLRLHIFRDGSVLEVFANDRFALATMIYIDDEEEGMTGGTSAFAENAEAGRYDATAAVFEIVGFTKCVILL